MKLAVAPFRESWRPHALAYAGFGVFALVYLWHYLPQGFSLYDDAYLLGLGQRIVDGDALYRDVSYFRTPLSPLIHAGWLLALGDSYTVLASRVIWGIELCGAIALVSALYRSRVNGVTLFLALCLSLVYATLLISFPWYTFDGVFFSALFAFSLWKKRPAIAGVFAGCAFLCKQSFIALVPATFAVAVVVGALATSGIRQFLRQGLFVGLGWILAVGVCALALSGWASASTLWEYVFVLPAEVNDLSLGFTLWQDIPAAFVYSWLIVALVALTLIVDAGRGIGVIGIAIVAGLFWSNMAGPNSALPFVITSLLYTLVLFWLVGVWLSTRTGEAPEIGVRGDTLTLVAVGVAVTYCSGLNYSGVVFAHTGSVLTIPLLVFLAQDVTRMSKKLQTRFLMQSALPAERSETPFRLYGVWSLIVLLLVTALVVHETHPYLESSREGLTVEFETPALRGLKSSPERVAHVDSLVEMVRGYTAEDETVMAFPEPACLNYLTGRKAYGTIQWWYRREFSEELADSIAGELAVDAPTLVVKGREMHADVRRKAGAILSTLDERFTTIDSVGGYYILLPRKSPEAKTGDDAARSD